jgi:hypothetical protein
MLLKAGTFTLENSVTCVVSVDDNLFLFFRYFNPMWLSLRDLFIVTIYFIIVVDLFLIILSRLPLKSFL